MVMRIGGEYGRFERRAFRNAVLASCLIHICFFVYAHTSWHHSALSNDAIFEFVLYDEIGGTAGGADTDDTVEQPETIATPEQAPSQPEQSEEQSGENTPEAPAEEQEPPEEPDPEPPTEMSEVPEPELEIEPEPEVGAKVKPDPIFVDTPIPLLEDKKPEEEEILLADATPRPRQKPKRMPSSEASPPPAPPPAPLLVASVPQESAENVLGGGGLGDGHGGTGDANEIGNPDQLRAYAGEIQRKLNQYKQYPSSASMHNIEGLAVVSFTIDLEGGVGQIAMVESSGNHELDSEALSLPTRAAPFPKFPSFLRRQSIRLTLPIQFSLH